jgi:hypothetical protein
VIRNLQFAHRRRKMKGFLAVVKQVANGLVYIEPLSGAVDPGFGAGAPPTDPDYGMGTFPHPGHGLPGYGRPDQDLPWAPARPGQGLPGSGGHPGNALPIAPVRPSPPIVLPPITTWPPHLPPGIDNTLPPSHGHPSQPIVIPPDPSIVAPLE